MNRLTCLAGGAVLHPGAEETAARLALYEDIHEAVEGDQLRIAGELAALRADGREKTVRYRELLAKKLQNLYLLTLFESKGL